MFACATKGISPGTRILGSPSTTASKKFPDITLSPDKRSIWDGGRVNIHCPKQDYWSVKTPTVRDLATWYMESRADFPGIPIVGAKRDIGPAFNRRRIHHDAESTYSTEFSANTIGGEAGIILFYMVLPFGFTCRPVIFCRVM